MSGGAFNHAYVHVRYFSDELDDLIRMASEPDLYDYSGPLYSPVVLAKLREIQILAARMSRLMRETEWLCSGDHSDDVFMRIIAQIESAK